MRAEHILDMGRKLLKSKGDDYTEDRDKNQFENFDRVAVIASWFTNPTDLPYAVLIGTKLARLSALLNGNKTPNNESILDTFVDGSNYFALWGGKRCSGIESTEEHQILATAVEAKYTRDLFIKVRSDAMNSSKYDVNAWTELAKRLRLE